MRHTPITTIEPAVTSQTNSSPAPLNIPKSQEITSQEVLSKAIMNVATRLEIKRGELASILGVSESTLSRMGQKIGSLDPISKEGQCALIVIDIYCSLYQLFGGNEAQCRVWIRNQNYHLNGCPIDMMRTIPGLNRVAEYLKIMQG